MKILVRRLLRIFGVDLTWRRPTLVDLLAHHQIKTALDVGANTGQFACALREWGYTGRIISFEPLLEPFRQLQRRAACDSRWEAFNLALGEYDGTATINVSDESMFSSFLPGLPRLYAYDAQAAAVRQQECTLKRLDSVIGEFEIPRDGLFLKVDAQGYERNILLGAARTLLHLRGMQLELSLSPLYAGEASLVEMVRWLQDYGFALVHVEPVGFDSERLSLLQLDCVFVRESG